MVFLSMAYYLIFGMKIPSSQVEDNQTKLTIQFELNFEDSLG